MYYHIKTNLLPPRCFDRKKCSDKPDNFKLSRVNWNEDEADVTMGISIRP